MASRLMVVVAHPDDETFGCGSVLLLAAAAGWQTAVLCATRGEEGESHDGTPVEQLGAKREAETRAAGEVLGVGRVDFLDLRDSGMTGPIPPDSLVATPVDDVRDQVRAHVEAYQPQVVVTLDGLDGHRDHGRIGEATLAAVDAADWNVERVYLFGVSQSMIGRWLEYRAAVDPTWERPDGTPGTPDELITTVVDASAHQARREEAIRQHTSQLSPFEGLPDDLRHAFLSTVELSRVRPPWSGMPRETRFP